MKRFFCLFSAALIATVALAGSETEIWTPAGNNIKTRWAQEVGPANSHPEYPRPQLVRPALEKAESWINLNGLWDYVIVSREETVMPESQGKILVPFCVESSLSGVGKRIADDQALWYETEIQIPSAWKGRKVLLHFGAVDNEAEVYLNGKLLGIHRGGYTEFSFDITSELKKKNLLSLKVTDPTDAVSACVPRGKQVSNPGGIWYTPVTGIWQTVWLESVADAYVKDYNVVAGLDGKLRLDVDVEGDADALTVEILSPEIGLDPLNPSAGRVKLAEGKTVPESGKAVLDLSIDNPRLWTPDEPYLYGLRFRLSKGGKEIDTVDGYAAVRTVGYRKDESGVKRLALNDRILFQFGPLDQGWWPDGLYTAPTAEALAWDIVKTKELGFNMIRKHIKVEPARWYFECDRLGMLVWQDMPCMACYASRDDWGQGDDYYGSGSDFPATAAQKDNFRREWAGIVAQLKKHPSIVVWVPFNEAWGQFDTRDIVDFTRTLDPTRLVNAASGGNWIEGAGDILDSHSYPNPRMRIIDSTMVNVLGEYGGIGRPIEGHTWEIGRKWGYVQYDTEDKVTDAYCLYAKDLIDIKQNDLCAAAVYTQTTDVEGEVNGFYTYDRKVLKVNAARVREANLRVIQAPCTPSLELVPPFAFHYKDPSAGVNDHIQLFTLRAGNLTMQVTNFGARVISLFTPDRNGKLQDVIVGYDNALDFVHNTGERYLGATVGRVANRIADGRFTLDGQSYTLPLNNNGQTLHGGTVGIDMTPWQLISRSESSICFGLTVPDMTDGFPGNLKIELTYTLTENDEFDIQYKATTDKATPVNLSNHAFYNLSGSPEGPGILDHYLRIDADCITAVNGNLIPTGKLMKVRNTPFDFREEHRIGERIDFRHKQLKNGNGYDHNWVLNVPGDGSMHNVCTVYEPLSGRTLEIITDQCGLQFYSGNFFDGSYCGKAGRPIAWRGAIALETQKWPDAVNHPEFPDTILRPGETYTQHSIYRFGVR